MRNPLTEVLLHWAGSDPTRVCIRTPRGETWTYGDLGVRSAQLAHALVSHEVRPGDRVAVRVEKCADVFSLNIACARVGAVYVPLNDSYTHTELLGLLNDAEPTLLVVDSLIDVTSSQITLADVLSEAATKPTFFEDVPRAATDPAAMLFTSGTTGRPKGALLSNVNLTAGTLTLSKFWEMTEHDVVLHTLPIFHVHGLYVAAYNAFAQGACLILLPAFDADEIIIELPNATMLMGVPTHYTKLLGDQRFSHNLTAHIRLFTSGSAPMLASTHKEFRERTGHTIVERYGLTETYILTSNPLHGTRKPGLVGLPLPDVQLRIDGGETGEIQVKGPTVFGGYWRRPELQGSEFTEDGWFKTGDIGHLDNDGYVEIVGRLKDLIITGGLNVYPKEIEEVLNSLPGILESAVVGLPDAYFGEAVTAVVVAQHGSKVVPDSVRRQARELLAPFKVPKVVYVLDSLPRNALGKVEKAQLRAILSE